MPHLLDNVDERLDAFAAEHKLPRYRRGQVRQWLFDKRADDWLSMSNLPKPLREQLAAELPIWSTETARHTTSDDGTEKLLLSLGKIADTGTGGAAGKGRGGEIECVLLRENVGLDGKPGVRRRTMCISTQVGCAMGCVFCASGLDGVERNLSSGEILEQLLRLQLLLGDDERLSHIVVMGMGEPLANLDALLVALDEARRDDGLGVSARRITVSTVGIPHAIRRLADVDAPYRLAISLHAPNDELRNEIVPINQKFGGADGRGVDAIIEAADYFYERSRRRITFEYVLLAGVNDHPSHARQLVRLLARREALLNVIPYNPVDGLPYETPSLAAQRAFSRVLTDGGVAVRFRHRKGDKINAACGQLRRQAASVVPLEA